jgi:hypothetical protein
MGRRGAIVIETISFEDALRNANLKEAAYITAFSNSVSALGNPTANQKALLKAMKEAGSAYHAALKDLHQAAKKHF